MANDKSKRHHYLPKKYLEGFTNEGGGFYIYDKEADKIFPSTPENMFLEGNLNTITLKEGETDFLEDMYSRTENIFWSSLEKIRNSNHKEKINLNDKMQLFLFLSILHWRLPTNKETVEELSQKFFSENEKDFKYFFLKSKTGEAVPKEAADLIKNSDGFKKSARLMLPFAPFLTDKKWFDNILAYWRFTYTQDGKDWNMVSDNPIITDGKLDNDPQKCLERFIFPISGRVLLINAGKTLQTELPREFTLQYNVAVLERAKRFVACPDRKFLELTVFYYQDLIKRGEKENIIKGLFNYIK